MTSKEWLTIGEAVAYLGEPIGRVFKLLEQGTIVSEGFGNGQTLVSKDSCDLWLANCPKPTAENTAPAPVTKRGRPKGAKSKQRAPKGYVTLSKAADLLGVHEDTPGAWARRGEIESLRSGGRVFIPKAAIAARLARDNNDGGAAPTTTTSPGPLTITETAVALGLSYYQVSELLRAGTIAGKKVDFGKGPARWEVEPSEVDRYKSRTRPAVAPGGNVPVFVRNRRAAESKDRAAFRAKLKAEVAEVTEPEPTPAVTVETAPAARGGLLARVASACAIFKRGRA